MDQEPSGLQPQNEGSNEYISQDVDMQDTPERQQPTGPRDNTRDTAAASDPRPLHPLRPLFPNTLAPNTSSSNTYVPNPYARNIQPPNPFGPNHFAANIHPPGTYGHNPYGPHPYGPNPYGPNTYVPNPYAPNIPSYAPNPYAPNISPPGSYAHDSHGLNPSAPAFYPSNTFSSGTSIAGPFTSGFLPSQGLSGSLANQGQRHRQAPDNAERILQFAGRGRGAGAGVTKSRAPAPSTRSQALLSDNKPKTVVRKDSTGKFAGTMVTYGLNENVRATMTDEQRLATQLTKEVGRCDNCRRSNTRCDMSGNQYEPCGACKKRLKSLWNSFTVIPTQPCRQVSFVDLRLHRKGPTINNDLLTWVHQTQQSIIAQGGILTPTLPLPPPSPNDPPLTATILLLSQGIGNFDHQLQVTVARFEPSPDDKYGTAYHWTDSSGTMRSMEVPPYFISDLDSARQNIRFFCRDIRETYIRNLIDDGDEVAVKTFQLALVVATVGQSKLVTNALDLWVAARLIEARWRVVAGGVAIGLLPVLERGHPFDAFTPVTPVMDAQLDELVIRDLLTPLAQQFLRRLQTKMDERKKENWLEIFLALFIVMNHIGLTVKDMKANATWKGLKTGNRGGNLTQGFIHACKTMLSHFHFVCAGSIPVSAILSDYKEVHGVVTTPAQREYLHEIKEEMNRPDAKLARWQQLSMYDEDMYWCYQLLIGDWRGDVPHAGEIDDYREEDFLSSSTI